MYKDKNNTEPYKLQGLINLNNSARNNKDLSDVVDIVMYYIKDTNVFPSINSIEKYNENTSHNRANKVMGLAIHLVGDIYAHEWLVNEEMFRKKGEKFDKNRHFNKDDFIDKDTYIELKRTVRNKEIAMRQLDDGKYLKSNEQLRKMRNYKEDDKRISGAKLYEDNTDFCDERYETAKDVISSMISSSGIYNFRDKNKKYDSNIIISPEKLVNQISKKF